MAFDELKGSSFTSVHENADCRLSAEPTVHRDRLLGHISQPPRYCTVPGVTHILVTSQLFTCQRAISQRRRNYAFISLLPSSTYDPIPTEQGQIRQTRDYLTHLAPSNCNPGIVPVKQLFQKNKKIFQRPPIR